MKPMYSNLLLIFRKTVEKIKIVCEKIFHKPNLEDELLEISNNILSKVPPVSINIEKLNMCKFKSTRLTILSNLLKTSCSL